MISIHGLLAGTLPDPTKQPPFCYEKPCKDLISRHVRSPRRPEPAPMECSYDWRNSATFITRMLVVTVFTSLSNLTKTTDGFAGGFDKEGHARALA